MNAEMERMMNSEIFGAEMIENGALDRKIWALEYFKGKTVFLGGSEGICRFLSGWKLWHKRTGAIAMFGNFLGILVDFLNI
jgi:hypothetical protein